MRDALVAARHADRAHTSLVLVSLPVVAETYDGALNDINGMHVTTEHVLDALATASGGPVAEGSVGGGTGMICHEFKGGTGRRRGSSGGWRVRSACWCRPTTATASVSRSTASPSASSSPGR